MYTRRSVHRRFVHLETCTPVICTPGDLYTWRFVHPTICTPEICTPEMCTPNDLYTGDLYTGDVYTLQSYKWRINDIYNHLVFDIVSKTSRYCRHCVDTYVIFNFIITHLRLRRYPSRKAVLEHAGTASRPLKSCYCYDTTYLGCCRHARMSTCRRQTVYNDMSTQTMWYPHEYTHWTRMTHVIWNMYSLSLIMY